MKLEVGTVIKFKSQVFNYHGCIEEGTIVSIEKSYLKWNEKYGFDYGGLSLLESSIKDIRYKTYIKDDIVTVDMGDDIAKYKFDKYSYTIRYKGANLLINENSIVSIVKTKEENIKNLTLKVDVYNSKDNSKNIKLNNLKINKLEDVKKEVVGIIENLNLNYSDFKIGNGSVYTTFEDSTIVCSMTINDIPIDYLAGDKEFSNIMAKHIFQDLEVCDRFKFDRIRQDRDVFNICS